VHLLDNKDGFTIVETLVVITILGLLVTLTSVFFTQIFNNPKKMLQGDAFSLARNEIDYCIRFKPESDTLYKNDIGNLSVKRKVTGNENNFNTSVSVDFIKNKSRLIELKVKYIK
jgi:prepilin-type N-terminal cleavage/methylation domain-containing protein